MHQVLIEPDALFHGFGRAVALLAFLKFEFVGRVRAEGQLFGRVGEQIHGRVHKLRGLSHEQPGGRGMASGGKRPSGDLRRLGVVYEKVDHASSRLAGVRREAPGKMMRASRGRRTPCP